MARITKIPCFLFVILAVFSCNSYLDVKEEVMCAEWEDTCYDQTISIDSSKRDHNVLIIGIDGFRADAMREDVSPFLFEFSNRNTTYFTDKQIVEEYPYSGPNWSSILTGVHWCKHRVINNDFESNRLGEFPHFFKYVEQADSSINTVSLVHWSPINERITLSHADYSGGNTDEGILRMARDILVDKKPVDADIMFLHFVDLDKAGHEFGFSYDVQEYRNTVTRLDNYVRELVSIIEEKRNNGEDWMIFVASDHGGEGKGHSDAKNVHVRHTIFYANHPELKFIPKLGFVSSHVDMVPTILDYMGINSAEFNCKHDGNSLLY